MLKQEIEALLAGRDLSAEETASALEKIAQGNVPPVQIGAFLAALRAKGESESELVGAARMLRQKCCFIDHGPREVIDTCGTGGMVNLMAAQAGVDIVDCALSPLGDGTSNPCTESLVATLQGTERDTGLDLETLNELAEYFTGVKSKIVN